MFTRASIGDSVGPAGTADAAEASDSFGDSFELPPPARNESSESAAPEDAIGDSFESVEDSAKMPLELVRRNLRDIWARTLASEDSDVEVASPQASDPVGLVASEIPLESELPLRSHSDPSQLQTQIIHRLPLRVRSDSATLNSISGTQNVERARRDWTGFWDSEDSSEDALLKE